MTTWILNESYDKEDAQRAMNRLHKYREMVNDLMGYK